MGSELFAVAQSMGGGGSGPTVEPFLTLTLALAQIAGLCTDMVICIKYGNMETV